MTADFDRTKMSGCMCAIRSLVNLLRRMSSSVMHRQPIGSIPIVHRAVVIVSNMKFSLAVSALRFPMKSIYQFEHEKERGRGRENIMVDWKLRAWYTKPNEPMDWVLLCFVNPIFPPSQRTIDRLMFSFSLLFTRIENNEGSTLLDNSSFIM